MKLTSLEIPDDEGQLSTWLDAQLASPDLVDLVVELLAVQQMPLTAPAAIDARAWLGAQCESFLSAGTRGLSIDRQRELLRRPWLLLALQEEIDEAGGGYWNELAWQSPHTRETLLQLQQQLTAQGVLEASGDKGTVTVPESDGRVRGRRGARWGVALALVSAAAIVIGIVMFRPQPAPIAAGWGWNERELLQGSPSADEYLARLADAGAKWRNKRPESKEAVVQRIREMRTGCQRLIDARHPPLSPEQELAFKQLCRKWAGQFDQILSDLEANKLAPLEARNSMDAIVDKLEKRLRSGELG